MTTGTIKENLDKNINYERALRDRYELDIYHRFGVQPPLRAKIAVEGIKKNWRRGR